MRRPGQCSAPSRPSRQSSGALPDTRACDIEWRQPFTAGECLPRRSYPSRGDEVRPASLPRARAHCDFVRRRHHSPLAAPPPLAADSEAGPRRLPGGICGGGSVPCGGASAGWLRIRIPHPRRGVRQRLGSSGVEQEDASEAEGPAGGPGRLGGPRCAAADRGRGGTGILVSLCAVRESGEAWKRYGDPAQDRSAEALARARCQSVRPIAKMHPSR